MTEVFKHQLALVESDQIGSGTRVWAYAHILPGARIGADCNICDHVFIENDVFVGDRVTIKCGVQLWDGVRLGDDVFVGPNATFTNDAWPRSREWPENYPPTVVEAGASIGANATILPGLTIGFGAMVGAGAVVTRSVPPHAVVTGNPAQIMRYVATASSQRGPSATLTAEPIGENATLISGVELGTIQMIRDARGDLLAREVGRGIPFTPKRVFVISNVSPREVRGQHAHKLCHQLLVCLKGKVTCLVDDGVERAEYCLNTPEMALHVPPMIWGTQYRYSSDAVLMVLASHEYDTADYIEDYAEFKAMKHPE